ncbi:MAG TPA: arginine deiminase family protein [Synergistaceae bacterium]|nr:arginine deiminase family protein [Synergistaceae bacterium]HPJ27048.1 arginine deiminase family protein [Synergistaceae bacterium]
MRAWGSQSEVEKIEKILVKHPREAYGSQAMLDVNWKDLGYTAPVNYVKALEEYEQFLSILEEHVPEVHFLPASDGTGPDSLYARDSCMITDEGAILFNMGKLQRRKEAAAAGDFFGELGLPLQGSITGEGTMEAGDMAWLDPETLAVGLSYRTNPEGVRQLREYAKGEFAVLDYPIPHWNGPEECLHLMSFISPVDRKAAVVYSKQMPVTFRQELVRRGYTLIEVPDQEYDTMACNVLALEPGLLLMIAGNPVTKKRLQQAGMEVLEFPGTEICWKGGGGPTCLTRPLLRRY